ncbi:hypothetical protein DF185_02555 [Marinifilum breve]|uniref:Acylneuraminate cytidylyltransferase n=1 Tax=Marinifilum breve TaxID=2184082 RepID=A0A2V4A413_9BACT|nr:hypothetical protein [Marinifilum breve]PXY02993.1 hypothetical protein DF185_02555 [Marinifilum breve]
MVDYRVGIIIQARNNSSRLPGKILLELPVNSGTSVLDHIQSRCEKIAGVKTIIATTDSPKDDIIANKYKRVFRGSEKDVLERYYYAAKQYGFKHIVRLTGDNPCVDYNILQNLINIHVNGQYDFTITEGLPLGMNFEIMTFETLEIAFLDASEKSDREHVTLYFDKIDKLNKKTVYFEDQLEDKIRVTMDYPSDYAFLNLLFSNLNRDFTFSDLKSYVKEYPWLLDINKNYQKRIFDKKEDEFREAVNLLNELEMYESSRALKDLI